MTLQPYAPLLVLVVMLPLILLRNRAPRTLRPQWLWVTPVVIVPLMGLALRGTSMEPGADHTPSDAA